MATKFMPFTGHGFSDPKKFDNWRLVWAACAIQLANTGIVGQPGSISEDPAALRAEVARIVNDLVPTNGGPVIETPYGPGRALSDPPDHPLPYHQFTTVLLERIYQADPSLFGPAALKAREQLGNYALTVMAPDGDLTPSGRSIQQSWVLASTTDLGALRANQGGKDAPVWRAYAERAFDRLVRVHGTLPDGTIPVVPGLKLKADPTITDPYSSISQYNGATLFYLQRAADQWPDHVPVGRLSADGDFLASDYGDGGPSLTGGRSGDVWWGIQGRKTRLDSRATQGIVALNVRTRSGWTDMLASRPIRARTKTDWILRTHRGEAKLELTRASGTSRHAVLAGRWVIGNRTLRAARWDVEVKGRRLVITTEPLRRGERLRAALYATPNLSGPQPTGRASSSGDTVTASGLARAVVSTWSKPGKVTATL